MPYPKRSTERRRRNKYNLDTIEAGGSVYQPTPPDTWGHTAKAWYVSLASSGQAVFYEPSDWQMAIIAGNLLDDWEDTRRPAVLVEFRHLCQQLMVTEGERRRARLEVERPTSKTNDKGDAAVASYRATLGVVKNA